MTSSSFRHLAPALRVFYGDTALGQLGPEIRRMGCRRAVVFCGRSLAASEPGLVTVEDALGELCVGAFTGVVEQSPVAAVEAGAEALRRLEADAVVVLGGGSAVVTARAATILLAEGRSAHELATVMEPGRPPVSPKLDRPKIPQFVLPTTPTTAFAKAGAAVSVPGGGRRLAMFDPKARAHALFFDPRLFMTAPAGLVRDATLDAFALAIQGLESARREPLADAQLLHAVRLIRRRLPDLTAEAEAVAKRGDLMLAALLVGQGTDATGGGLASAVGHAIGARFGVANGQAKAIVLPHAVRFNAPATDGRLVDVAEALGLSAFDMLGDVADLVSEACAHLFGQLGMPSRLQALGVRRDDLARIAADAADDFFLSQNPRRVADGDLLALLEAAW